MTIWEQVGIIVVGSAVNCLFTMWLFRWRKSQEKPSDELEQAQRDIVILRGQVKYIQGILNGRHWKQRED